jgi:hypothetical protein
MTAETSDATLPISVVSIPRLHRQVLVLRRELNVVITGSRTLLIGCVAHAVLGSQFFNDAVVDLAHALLFSNFKEPSTRFFGDPL